MKILILVLFVSFNAIGHPVIYKNGWAFNSTNMSMDSNNYVTYSFTNRLSVGAEYNRFDEDDMGLVKLNSLLWRKNGDDSQANVYFHGGASARPGPERKFRGHQLWN